MCPTTIKLIEYFTVYILVQASSLGLLQKYSHVLAIGHSRLPWTCSPLKMHFNTLLHMWSNENSSSWAVVVHKKYFLQSFTKPSRTKIRHLNRFLLRNPLRPIWTIISKSRFLIRHSRLAQSLWHHKITIRLLHRTSRFENLKPMALLTKPKAFFCFSKTMWNPKTTNENCLFLLFYLRLKWQVLQLLP